MFSEIRIQLALQCILTIGLAFGESGSDVNDVMTLLFTTQKYNKKIRPVKDQWSPINVQVFFHLRAIIDFDEEKETLKTAGYLSYRWTDEYLQWDMTEFNSTSYISLPQDDIWKPDIILENSIASFTGLGSPNLNVYVDYAGKVEWYPVQVFQSTCEADMLYFPFDVETCKLNFTAWSYAKDWVTFDPWSEVLLQDYTPNSMWDIHSTAARCHFAKAHCVSAKIKFAHNGPCMEMTTHLSLPTTTTLAATTTTPPSTTVTTMKTTTFGHTSPTTTRPPLASTTQSILMEVFCHNLQSIYCNQGFNVVCGSDGSFYPNEYAFEHRSLKRRFNACA